MPKTTSQPNLGILLVTGGGRGIGAVTARLAAAKGYTVCVNYREQRGAAEGVVGEIQAVGGRAFAVRADIATEAEVVRLFRKIDEVGTLTALVNNAGVLETQTRLDHLDAARLERVFATNVFGAFLCTKEAVLRMSSRGRGHRQRLVGGCPHGLAGGVHRLRGDKGGHRHPDGRARQEGRGGGRPGQRGAARLCQHGDSRARRGAGAGGAA